MADDTANFSQKCLLGLVLFLLGVLTSVIALLYNKIDVLEEIIIELKTTVELLHG
ncbi:MAG: hypothetical protein ACXAEN_12390 [Candidatus Thorarchaeota archaeon]|jgi:hypothetical protein